MNAVEFAKGQALGNDYLVAEVEQLTWEFTPPRVRAICDRHRGAGSDGILLDHGLIDAGPERRTFRLRIWNPDGTRAEKSGNGLRIYAAYLHAIGRVATGETFGVELATDTVAMRVEGPDGAGGVIVTVDMGPARFLGEAVGFTPATGVVLDHPLPIDGAGEARVNLVSLGNPHCVVLVDRLDRDDFVLRGPRLATHPAFAAGTNVQFARPTGPGTIDAWIWERGAGETLASGSSACAVAAVALRRGLLTERNVRVDMPGGSVDVSIDDAWQVRLRGPASMVYWGHLDPGSVEAWTRL